MKNLMPELGTTTRKKLKSTEYACPIDRKLPIHNAAHVRNAMARFNQVKSNICHPAIARRRIIRAAKKFGVDVKDFAKVKPFKEHKD